MITSMFSSEAILAHKQLMGIVQECVGSTVDDLLEYLGHVEYNKCIYIQTVLFVTSLFYIQV